jgi:aquaglyceroporin related protein
LSQILGAVTAGGIAYCLYHNSIVQLGDVPWNPEGISFYTEPIAGISNVTRFFNEFVATSLLMCSIFALGDDSNAPPGAGMHSLIIGLLVFGLSLCLGYNTAG